MNGAEFRNELQNIMPGYKWTVHKTSTPDFLSATGIQSSASHRLSTLRVNRTQKESSAWYSVMSAGHGTKSPWEARIGGTTIARALRDLQTHYQRQAAKYHQLAARLEQGRKATNEVPG